MEEQIKFIKDYLNGCKAIFNGKNLEDTDKALTILAEIETELKKLRVADVSGRSEQLKAFDDLFDYAWNLAQFNEQYEKLNEIKERF